MEKIDIWKISQIADRVSSAMNWDKTTIMMDLTYCIEGGCELRLTEMLNARIADLIHDICGINQHLNHETLKLEGGFLPRFAGKEDKK